MNELQTLIESIKSLTDLDEEAFNDEMLKDLINNLNEQFSPEIVNQSVSQMIQNFEEQGLTKAEAIAAAESLSDTIKEMIYGQNQFTGNKKVFVDTVLEKLFDLFNQATTKYHSYSIELPMTVDVAGGAKVPTYAHETDAAADLYAAKDITLAPYSMGNIISTGIKIQLPEGWLAMILPRSSMGTKTALRLSNSVGLIDSGYRGELGIIYDNLSEKEYEIKAGDRIAQLLVMPNYRFQAKVVDILANSDRGEGGFGASGK